MVSQCQLSSLNMPGNCAFNVKWLENDEYKQWIVMGQSKFKAKCTLCRKEIDISNMGEGALKSHKKSNKHLDLETKMAGNLVLSDCFKYTQPQKIANTCTSRNIMEESVATT